MRTLKKWWREVLIVVTLIILMIWGSYVKALLEQYQATTPAYFWLISEVLYDTSILLFMLEWKGKEFAWNIIQGKGLLSSLSEFTKLGKKNRPSGKAWWWFRVNRVVALLQPGATAVMVLLTELPSFVKWSVAVFLAADFLHTIFTLIWSYRWQTSD